MRKWGNVLSRLLAWLRALVFRAEEPFTPGEPSPRLRLVSWLSFRRGVFRRRKYRLERER